MDQVVLPAPGGGPRDLAPGAGAGRGASRQARALAAPVAMAALALGAAALVATVDPNEAGSYPACPFRALTGWYCPGCGTLRAAHAVLHGDLARAVDMNVLAVLAVPLVLASWLAWLRRAGTGRPRTWLSPPWFPATVGVVLVVFTVARNIPVLAPLLAP